MTSMDQGRTKDQLIAELGELRMKLAECEETLINRKRDEDALRKIKASLANAQRIARIGNWDWDIVRNELYWSDEIYRIFGMTPKEFDATYEAFLNTVHSEDRDLVKKSVEDAIYRKKPYAIDHRMVLSDGSERIVHEQAEVIYDAKGLPLRMTGTVQDITEQKRTESELKKLSMVMEHSVNVIMITNAGGDIEYVNPIFEQITGWPKEEVIGKNPRILSSGETTKAEYEELWGTVTAGKTWRGIFKNKRKNGDFYLGNGVITPIKNDKGEITHFLAVQEDITEKRVSEERIQYLAHYDDMTGLINRARFTELLSEWVYHSKAHDKGFLLVADIDEFKLINDTYGHGVGDELLRRTALLLQGVLKEEEFHHRKGGEGTVLGRLGGDEFSAFIPGLNEWDGMALTEKIRRRFEEFRLMEGIVHATLSIGASLFPEHGRTIKELFAKVDAAMYRAKEMGGNTCHLYSPDDRVLENIHLRLREKERIQKALREDLFEPWFQPILSLKDGKIHHYEALARMIDEESIFLPREFIDTAEAFGLVSEIDKVITEKTMNTQAAMARKGMHLTFGINLSGKELGNEQLLSFLQSKIKETGADPNHLLFEITETAAVHDLDRAVKFITELKSMGCRFSLDDFGVGFTSFVYLKRMQVDYIKIDGSFVRRLHENKDDQHIVKAITDVAKGMGIKTVAEFVEKEETLRLLKEYGVDYAQGYLIGKPGPELL